MRWIDLTAHNVRLIPVKLSSGLLVLILSGEISPEKATAVGFKQSPNGVWYSTDYSQRQGGLLPIKLSDFTGEFPGATFRDMSIEEVTRPPAAPGEEEETAAHRLMRDFRKIGLNGDGEEVFEDAVGRFVRTQGGIERMDDTWKVAPRFLRAGEHGGIYDQAAAQTAAHGYVIELIRGKQGGESSLREFYRVLVNAGDKELSKRDLRNLQGLESAVEVAAAMEIRNLVEGHTGARAQLLEEVSALDERLPRVKIDDIGDVESLERGFTPLLAFAARRLVRTAGRHVLLPYAANAMLAGIITDAESVTILAPDNVGLGRAHFSRVTEREGVNGLLVDFERHNYAPDSADTLVIAAPVNGAGGAIDDYALPDPSHYQSARALTALKQDGDALLMIAGKTSDLDADQSAQSIAPFLAWANHHYKLGHLWRVDGSFFGRRGDYRPSFMVQVLGRRYTPGDYPVPALRIFHSRDELLEGLRNADELGINRDMVGASEISRLLAGYNDQLTAAEEVVINDYQRPYVPACTLGEAELALPKNLVSPTRIAMNRHVRRHGNTETTVAEALDLDAKKLEGLLSPEQVDAIALGLARMLENRAFLIGDQTGTGKGRIQAALMAAKLLNGEQPIFVTKSPDLFSDIWRDFQHIGMAHLPKPLVINDETIYDTSNNVVAGRSDMDVRRFVVNGELPDGYNMIFCTYNVLAYGDRYVNEKQRPHRRQQPETFIQQRALAIIAHAEGRPVFVDECHLATGEAAFYRCTNAMLERASDVVYSSATYMRDPRGLRLYSRIFPTDVSASEIVNIARRGGAPLQEVLSQMLVADGAMVRREHNFAGTKIEYLIDTAREAYHEQVANELAGFMQAVNATKGVVASVVDQLWRHYRQLACDVLGKHVTHINDDIARHFRVEDMGFTNIAHNVAKNLALALKQEYAAELAVQALREGKKPLVVVNANGNALHEGILPKLSAKEAAESLFGPGVEADYPDIKDVLRRASERLFRIHITTIEDEQSKRKPVRTEVDLLEVLKGTPLHQPLLDQVDELRNAIGKVSDVPFAPLDFIRDRIEAAGFTVAEISGRSHCVRVTQSGAALVPLENRDRHEIKLGFNNGRYDALLGTVAISTGSSLHASREFSDQRQRVLIEVEIMPTISDRIQLLGRVSRRNQTSTPEIKTLSTGLPIEDRLAAMSNESLKQLSASVTSNRRSPQALDAFDLFNREGDEAVVRILSRNPDWIDAMYVNPADLNLKDNGLAAGELTKRVTGLMILLPVAQQRTMLAAISEEYDLLLEQQEGLLAAGMRVGELDLRAVHTRREIYKGQTKTHYTSEFDRPVEITEIAYKHVIRKLPDSNTLLKMVESARTSLRLAGVIENDGSFAAKHIAFLEAHREQFMQRIEARYHGRNWSHMAESYKREYDMVLAALPHLMPGNILGGMDRTRRIISDVNLPPLKNAGVLQEYRVSFIEPEWGVSRTSSVISLFDVKDFGDTVDVFGPDHEFAAQLDELKDVARTEHRILLTGNMFEAARIAYKEGLGRPVIYTDDKGVRHRAIMCPRTETWKSMMNRSVPFSSSEIALGCLLQNPWVALQTPSSTYSASITVRITVDKKDGQLVLSGPNETMTGSTPLADAIRRHFGAGRVTPATKTREQVIMSCEEARDSGILDYMAMRGDGIYVSTRKGETFSIRDFEERWARSGASLDDYFRQNLTADVAIDDILDTVRGIAP
ncbi:MAG: hypothetical protein CVV05_00575 [Gammaproteobacteria bacterium HGW-Gammaproteobacteria-1]|jgi:hypothetical protein|nr:MAG: hypothetical protein CVV05_00575 [Gammaproteobacteria bacterium HGW-Gammaproteobacteria-1]